MSAGNGSVDGFSDETSAGHHHTPDRMEDENTSARSSRKNAIFSASLPWTNGAKVMLCGSLLLFLISCQTFFGSFHMTRNTLLKNTQSQQKQQQQQHHQPNATSSSLSLLHHQSHLQTRGWMQTIIDFRIKLAKIAQRMDYDAETTWYQQEIEYEIQNRHNYTFDISPIYNVMRHAIETVGVRGLLFDVLNDDYDYYLYFPKRPEYECFKNHGVGPACPASESWWFYHYAGATIADHLLSQRRGIRNEEEDDMPSYSVLWDGSTNQRVTSMADLLHEIQRLQHLPYVNSASFHAQHAIIWQYVAQVYPTIQEYPSELADSFCRASEKYIDSQFAPTVGKSIPHECYHGFGHAMFYTVAKRQMKQQIGTTLTFESERVLPTTTPSISARLQVRPNSGFELTKEAMCQVYRLCKGAGRQYDEDDEEEEYPHSRGVRVCLEGVVHSVRLFSDTRHDKEETIEYVMEEMQRCEKQGTQKQK